MIVIDTSAIIATLRNEPERGPVIEALAQSGDNRMSAGTLLEALIVAKDNKHRKPAQQLDELIADYDISIEPFTPLQARIAGEAHRRFGRGSGHPAKLNFGDCMAYALAKSSGAQLLFKGQDFAATDLISAL